MAIVGLTVWAWHWSGVLARRRHDPDGEANSTIRRAFLYLTLGVGGVVALASATLVLYRLVGSVLGARLGGDAVSELSTPIGAAVMAAIVLAYHGILLRADQRRRPVEAPAGAPGPAASPEPDAAAEPGREGARRPLDLVGPVGADFEAALGAARASLPGGFDLVPREP